MDSSPIGPPPGGGGNNDECLLLETDSGGSSTQKQLSALRANYSALQEQSEVAKTELQAMRGMLRSIAFNGNISDGAAGGGGGGGAAAKRGGTGGGSRGCASTQSTPTPGAFNYVRIKKSDHPSYRRAGQVRTRWSKVEEGSWLGEYETLQTQVECHEKSKSGERGGSVSFRPVNATSIYFMVL